MGIADKIKELAQIDLFKKDAKGSPTAGVFVGRPFYLDFDRCNMLVADAWKHEAKGLPQGGLLLAYYENEVGISEVVLLRVLKPCTLPTDAGVISSMVEYYKDDLRTAEPKSNLDSFTKYEFGFSGMECRVIGTFYKAHDDKLHFGADVENFFSAHHYRVFKPNSEVLKLVVNYSSDQIAGSGSQIKIGHVRYSSSRRFQDVDDNVPVYVSPNDFLGKRTALFGMTRTGKSNTVKKIIQATVEMSDQAKSTLSSASSERIEEILEPLTKLGVPKYPVGQIIFDVNGEYANQNLQDKGTAIFEIYKDRTQRYSVLEKDGFKVMKINFYKNIQAGFNLIRSYLSLDTTIYLRNFLALDIDPPEDPDKNGSAWTRYNRILAAYQCCLYKAGFKVPDGHKVRFKGNKELNEVVVEGGLDPSRGLPIDEAQMWFERIWEEYVENQHHFFADYKKKKGKDFLDEDMKAVLTVLTKKTEGGGASIGGFLKLKPIKNQHTSTIDKPFPEEIEESLRRGDIVIVDLSQGDVAIQIMYSEMICKNIFASSMSSFIKNKPNNFIQFYFEEAHNLFPKKEDKDYKQIYNRIAKEGAKLNLAMIYATQEVSSISSNILKNTQNWFIAHLNNRDETKEIRKFYDFEDFSAGLIRFSAENDKGFVRMKSYSNPFVVPVQVDLFQASSKEGS
ncbi:MAG TPA: ATPase [Flavobacteriales bacterium]|nr:ATPase [Flavobacteriales bacterium]